MNAPRLDDLVAGHRDALARWIAPRAGWLLRFESADDLAQGAVLRVLERGGEFRYEGEDAFRGWLHTVTRSYLADRANYWSALKRRSAALLRLTAGGSSNGNGTPAAGTPRSTRTGPATTADRREQLTLAVQVLATLPPRDADLVRWATEGVDLREQAERLGISYEAARKASRRALSRFRDAYRFASGI